MDVHDKQAAELLRQGARWQGTSWNTSRASKALHAITGVPLVSGDFTQYVNAFLYAVAITLDLEIPSLSLSDRAAEAAFNLDPSCSALRSGEVLLLSLAMLYVENKG